MANLNNPAGRLYILLDKFRKHQDNTPIVDAWSDVFEMPKDNTSEMLIAVSEVVKLVEETKHQILSLDVEHELYLRPFIEIQKVFTLSFGHTLANARSSVSDTVMFGLEYCDELLSREVGEKPIEEAILEDLLSDVNVLIEEVNASDVPQDLKILMLGNLNNISWAITYYKIHGAKGLKEAAEGALGSIVFHALRENERPDEAGEELVNKYGKLIFQAMSIVADAYALAQLTAGVVETFFPLIQ